MNSCTANAVAAALHFDMRRQKIPTAFRPSRLFIYFNERRDEGTLGTDPHGRPVQMADCIRAVHEAGSCPEELWPYDEHQLDAKPPQAAYQIAGSYCSQQYHRVPQTLAALKACLAQGYPFLFGARVYPAFLYGAGRQTGLVSMPAANEHPAGGHALLAVGYDDATQHFLIRNSFGTAWGVGGHGQMPYAYLLDPQLTFDHWVIEHIADPQASPPSSRAQNGASNG